MQRLKPFVMLILASLVASAAAPTGRRLTHENVEPSLRTPLDYTEAELLNKTCTPRDSYTNLSRAGAESPTSAEMRKALGV